ncbi:MAG: elongation factor G [Candidatus Dojkabacteria bacterium]|nr:elongation factor G [Candidatus Dojkabacteria bacterium]
MSAIGKKVTLDKVRNFGIIAHIDAGKTTLSERILFYTGKIYKLGEVHEGAATMDWMVQERERGITITSAATTCFWTVNGVDYRYNLIDTPGHIDFTAEVERSLRVLDGAVCVLDSSQGVEPQSETVWRQADKYGVPRLIYANKLAKMGGDLFKTMDSIRSRLGVRFAPVLLPIGVESEFKGVVDLIKMKAIKYYDDLGKDVRIEEIPEDMVELAKEYRAKLIDQIAEYDDAVMEKYLAGEELTEQEILMAMRKGVLQVKFFPLFCGDALSNKGPQVLLDYIALLLPSPLDRGSVTGHNPLNEEKLITRNPDVNEPLTGLAFKIAVDPHVGRLTFFRVYSGKITSGSYVYNSTRGEKERISRIFLLHANQREEVPELTAGEIGALVGLKVTKTGDTLCDESNPIRLEGIKFAEPVISRAVEPKTKADQEKLSEALGKLADEDPTLRVTTDQETGQLVISGMGELHLDIIIDRLKREFNVDVNTGNPQVAYRETIQGVVEQEGKYIRQSGGRGQYGHVKIKIEPCPEKDFEFVNEIVGGVIPKEYIPSVEKGIRKAIESGVLAGYPVVNVRVRLFDGSFHEVDSSDAAFQIAASMAFKDGMKQPPAQAVLLEPIMKVEVTFPTEYQGAVQGSILSRRGLILGTEQRGNVSVLFAEVPLAEMFGYTTEIRSITSGRGSPSMEFCKYAPVPANIQEQIIKGKSK